MKNNIKPHQFTIFEYYTDIPQFIKEEIEHLKALYLLDKMYEFGLMKFRLFQLVELFSKDLVEKINHYYNEQLFGEDPETMEYESDYPHDILDDVPLGE